MTRTVLVTGATGFIGRAVTTDLRRRGWKVRTAANRNAGPGDLRIPLTPGADWSSAVAGCDCVVHLAARAHVLRETALDPLAEFIEVNAAATQTLAKAALANGVRRFVFMSSIAVNGPMLGAPLTEGDLPKPETDYGHSKLLAEQQLQALLSASPMELTILRPPLVFGPGVSARFLQLLNWANSGLPLPLGGIGNRRSLLSLDNLTDAIAQCIANPAAASRTFMVADDAAISTSDLVRVLARHLRRPARLLNVPEPLLLLAASLVGRRGEAEKVTSSLVLDTTLIRQVMDWTPPNTLDAGLAKVAEWYRDRSR